MSRGGRASGLKAFQSAVRRLPFNTIVGVRVDDTVDLWVGDLPKNRTHPKMRDGQEALRERLLRDLAAWFNVPVATVRRIDRPFRESRETRRARANMPPPPSPPPPRVPALSEDLATLGLSGLPSSRFALRHAWSRIALRTHPDQGGSDASFIAARAAYERVSSHLRAQEGAP
jgi:hypothetical protein